jgi:hypothetical protein
MSLPSQAKSWDVEQKTSSVEVDTVAIDLLAADARSTGAEAIFVAEARRAHTVLPA